MSNTDKKLDILIQDIQKLINNPVAAVAPVAPVAPILPLIPPNSGDHDLLTKLDTKVDQIQFDVTALKAQNSIYITRNEFIEVVRIQRTHDDEIKVIQTFKDTLSGKMWGVGIMAGTMSAIIGVLISHFWK